MMYDLINKFYMSERRRLVKIVANRAGSKENAEDVVQTAFERALRYRRSFDPTQKVFEAWFVTILNNALRDFKADERLLGMGVEYKEELDERIELTDIEGDLAEAILAEIEKKPFPVRQALFLYFVKQYAPREVVQILDMTNGYVRVAVHEFKKELREKYGDIV
jgi:RNA polymerase sigma-70 factor (ECF subfamily)